MKIAVITHNEIEGFHRWPDAPEYLGYLRERHRHVFVIECLFRVTKEDRQTEIITKQHEIDEYMWDNYGRPAEFHDFSCETIAKRIIDFWPDCVSCTVREDGFGGAVVTR